MKFPVYSQYPADTEQTIQSLKKIFAGTDVQVAEFNSADLHNGILQEDDTVGFSLPGITGEVSGYTDQIGEVGLQSMSESVRAGRVMLTSFAGSYFISRQTIFEPIWGKRKTRTPVNPIFKGVAHGPASAISQRANEVLLPIQYKVNDTLWKVTNLPCASAPVFYPDDPESSDLEILARYATLPQTPVAGASLSIGEGKVIILAAMPHVGWLQNLMKSMKPESPQQQDFTSVIANRLQRQILTYREKFSI